MATSLLLAVFTTLMGVSLAQLAQDVFASPRVAISSYDLSSSPLETSSMSPREDLVQTLVSQLVDEQYQETTSYRIGRWATQRGLFPSYVHLNTHGGPIMHTMRETFQIPDDNMFVTQFVAYALIEAVNLGTVTPDDDLQNSIDMAMDAFQTHRDGNHEEGVPIYCFWNQQFVNETWVSSPANLIGLMSFGKGAQDWLEKEAEKHDWKGVLAFLQMMQMYSQMFRIPADADDTGVNLGLGGLLGRSPSFSRQRQQWLDFNHRVSEAMTAYKKYAYRPFGNKHSDYDDLVDPRTYFWAREYLLEKKGEAERNGEVPSLLLVSTWLTNVDETKNYFRKARGNVIPGNVNNFDASVGANAIFGMSSTILSQGRENSAVWFDDEMQQLYENTADLVAWVINKRMLQYRQDLVLLYYPPSYDFFWFVARHVQLLRSQLIQQSSLPYPVMERVLNLLEDGMSLAGTEQVFGSMKRVKTKDGTTQCFWDEFLGAADTTLTGVPKPAHGDRLFSTAVAINALIDTWTTSSLSTNEGDKAQLSWKKNTPKGLRATVRCAVDSLVNATKEGRLSDGNSFFSGSYKGHDSSPQYFPMNRLELFDGTTFVCGKNFTVTSMDQVEQLIGGIRGVMDPYEYQDMFTHGCMNVPTPLQFGGYNAKDPDSALPGWPYWSAPPLTKAMTVLALAKVDNLSSRPIFGEI